MSNYTPATATVISSLPFTHTQDVATDVALSPTAGGFASTCDPLHYHPVWYKFTTGSTQRMLSVGADDPGATFYSPICSIWTGTPPSLTQYRIVNVAHPGDGNDFCDNLGGGFYFQVPVQPNTTYYFQFTAAGNHVEDGSLVVYVAALPALDVAAGSIVIPDDQDGFPAVVLSTATGAAIYFLPDFPAGELADFLPDYICVQNGQPDTGVVILDSTYAVVASADFAPDVVVGIKCDRTAFYILTADNTGALTVHKINTAGAVLQTWTLPSSWLSGNFAVSPGGTRCYVANRQNNEPVHAYDLTNSVALTDLSAGFTGETPWAQGDGFCDSGGDVYIGYVGAGFTNGKIRRFTQAGTLARTYTLSANVTQLNRWARDPDGASMWIWGYPTFPPGSTTNFEQIRLSDGAVLNSVLGVPVMGASGGPSNSPVGGISNSCPILITPFGTTTAAPPAVSVVTERPIRRLRRAPHLWDNAQGNRMIYGGAQLLIETGSPRTEIATPLYFGLQWSDDGGNVWSNIHWAQAQWIGQYKARVMWRQLGYSRDRIFQVVNSDAAKIIVLDLLLVPDPAQGGG